MSASGRTSWWSKDAAWLRRELIVELGEEFGPGGPLVIDALSGWAQEQRESGLVRGGWRALARETFLEVEQTRAILEHAARIGALDDLDVDPDGRRFTVRVSGWQADQRRGRAASRKAAERQRAATDDSSTVTDRDMSRGVTPGHGECSDVRENAETAPGAPSEQPVRPAADSTQNGSSKPKAGRLSRSVTPSALPDLTREEELHPTPNPYPASGTGARRPTPPSTRRKRDQDAYAEQLEAWAPHPRDLDTFGEEWAQIAQKIHSELGGIPSLLAGMHPHRIDEHELVLAVPGPHLPWIEQRYGARFLPAVDPRGRRLTLIACQHDWPGALHTDDQQAAPAAASNPKGAA